MGQKKLQRFAEIETFPNVLIYPEGMPGRWGEFFKNNHPLTLELACGKGDYTLALARRYPERNFLGVDLKGNRIWRGAKTALEEPLPNAAFLRSQIDKLDHYFAPGEIPRSGSPSPIPSCANQSLKNGLPIPNSCSCTSLYWRRGYHQPENRLT